MKRILLCFLLLIGIFLSGCTGQINQPDTPPSNSEESGVLPGSESGGSTEMPPKEPTIPSEESKQVLTLTIDGIAVDVRWEDDNAVSELLDYVKDAHIVVHTSAYPKSKEIEKQFDQEYCWLSGEELSAIIEKEDFQWIWAVLCGFPKDIPLEKILEYPLLSAQEYNGYYSNPVSVQHPLASVEIIPSDSSWMIMVSKEKALVDQYQKKFPKAEDLSLFNQKKA